MFVIDLERTASKVALEQISEGAVKNSMNIFNYTKTSQLLAKANYDFKMFLTEKEGNRYLTKYLKVLNGLDNNKICKDRSLPCILYKRRYIVQTLMKEKMQTFRHYDKGWKRGQLFNLYDQTYFLTVQLVSIKEEEGKFKYKFKLI